MEPMFKLPSPREANGSGATTTLNSKPSFASVCCSSNTNAMCDKKPERLEKTNEMLRRRPDIEEVLLEALEFSVDEVLQQQEKESLKMKEGCCGLRMER